MRQGARGSARSTEPLCEDRPSDSSKLHWLSFLDVRFTTRQGTSDCLSAMLIDRSNMTSHVDFSFVLPVFDEAEVLSALYSRLTAVLDQLEGTSEVILVDDGSTDDSWRLMRQMTAADDRFRCVRLSRNFGHQFAITAGLDLTRGDAVIVMDSDLQHPPEVVPRLVERWREGYQVVSAARQERKGEGRFKQIASRAFYRVLGRLANVEMQPDVGDFRLVDRRALDALLGLRENTRYVRGLFAWIGFSQIAVSYESEARFTGRAKYTPARMTRLAVHGIASFSNVPLHLALFVGFITAGLSLLIGVSAIVTRLAGTDLVPGWLSIVCAVSFLGGVQLFVMGVLGIYLGRVYAEVKNRPLYVVWEAEGFDGSFSCGGRVPRVFDEE